MAYSRISGKLLDVEEAKALGETITIDGIKYEIVEVNAYKDEYAEVDLYRVDYTLKKVETTNEDLQKL